MSRQEQKLKTRQNIIHAAFSLLDENRSLSAISLREVAREAGIAPTSFYRHFKDMDELGLTLVDEAGLALRRLLLREHTGTSSAYRLAVFREIQHFVEELTDYIIERQGVEYRIAQLQADAMVRLVFSAGAEALEADTKLRLEIGERVKAQLRFVQMGATTQSFK